jgi:antitoxin component HigA of HigAB toxin-antitoxin module
MAIEGARDRRFLELVSEFPLRPIADDHSYRSAIKILDRLFARDDHRTPSELEYFRALAEIASKYEHKNHAIY